MTDALIKEIDSILTKPSAPLLPVYALYHRGDIEANGSVKVKDLELCGVLDLNEQIDGFRVTSKQRIPYIYAEINLDEKEAYLEKAHISRDPEVLERYQLDIELIPETKRDLLYGTDYKDDIFSTKVDIGTLDFKSIRCSESVVSIERPDTLQVRDVAAYTGGTSATVGSGQTYALLSTAYTDLGAFTADGGFSVQSAITEPAEFTTGNDFGSYLFDVDINGYTITCNGAGLVSYSGITASGTLTFHDSIIILANPQGSTTNNILFTTVTGTPAVHVYNNKIVGNTNLRGLSFFNSSYVVNCYANIITDCVDGITILNGGALDKFENCTIYDCVDGIDATGEAVNISNFAVYNCTTNYKNISAATGKNNLGDGTTHADGNWATGTNNLTERTFATDFVNATDFIPNPVLSGLAITPTITGFVTGYNDVKWTAGLVEPGANFLAHGNTAVYQASQDNFDHRYNYALN